MTAFGSDIDRLEQMVADLEHIRERVHRQRGRGHAGAVQIQTAMEHLRTAIGALN